MSHRSVSLLPLLISDFIWQLNCQNNFLPSGSGGKSMKIATKFNIVGSILVWYIHINTFLARAIIKLTVFHCRFATMSPEMREMEHGGCRIASPARAVRALFRLESWATRVGEVDRGTSASSRMTAVHRDRLISITKAIGSALAQPSAVSNLCIEVCAKLNYELGFGAQKVSHSSP